MGGAVACQKRPSLNFRSALTPLLIASPSLWTIPFTIYVKALAPVPRTPFPSAPLDCGAARRDAGAPAPPFVPFVRPASLSFLCARAPYLCRPQSVLDIVGGAGHFRANDRQGERTEGYHSVCMRARIMLGCRSVALAIPL